MKSSYDQEIKRIGRNIRAIRADLGYSQEKLSELCGLDRTYIGGVERGERNLGVKNLLKIANALGVEPAHLFDQIQSGN